MSDGPEKLPDPGLYLIATPIGNARDITLRALDILAVADHIACEDTRVTGRLLQIHNLTEARRRGRLSSYHDHNASQAGAKLIRYLEDGKIVALVSDAGTPLISDPGYRLVNEARDRGIAVHAIPGASAVLAALTASGLPTDRFLFAGFAPNKAAARQRFYAEFLTVPATLLFYETAPRLQAALADMALVFGDRLAVVARELTKKFEEIRSGRLSQLVEHYQKAGPPKGEIVLLLSPPEADEAALDDAAVDALLRTALETMTTKDAARQVATASSRARKELYSRALALAAARKSETGGGTA
jgi:16S rRNA (cytidine1402-2'-O)-methyltransferase